MPQRRYPELEYQRVEGQPLPIARLAAIWAQLPEGERLGFILSLDEAIADRVIEATAPAQPARRHTMLTDERVKGLSDGELERLADGVGYGSVDERDVAKRALLEKVRRTEAAQQAARLAAPAIAAKESAKTAYDAAGLPAAGFAAWYQERLAKETGEKLDDQRAAARHLAQRSF